MNKGMTMTIKIYTLHTLEHWDRVYVTVKDETPVVHYGDSFAATALLKRLGMDVEHISLFTKTEAKKILGKDFVARLHGKG